MDYKEKVIALLNSQELSKEQKEKLENIFPELKESDDVIRKEMLEYCYKRMNNEFSSITIHQVERWLAWLEKQGEHKKFRDAIQVGDKVTRNEDGVLVNLSQLNRVAKPADKQGEQKPADIQSIEKRAYEVFPDDDDENTPLYRQAFIDGAVDYIDCGCKKSSAWGKEDKQMIDNIIDYMEPMPIFFESTEGKSGKEYTQKFVKNAINWLKSLKDRIQPKQEWSERDENHIKSILSTIECCKAQFPNAQAVVEAYNADIEWLNSIRPQNKWKPSDEQMVALKHAFNDCSIAFADMKILATLYEQLKALHRYEQDT